MIYSNSVAVLANKFPNLFKKNSIESLVASNKISYQTAMDAITSIESNSAMDGFDMEKGTETPLIDDAIAREIAGTKFKAMLEQLKKDDTFMFDEFVSLDNARNKLAAEIIAKNESNFNLFLEELKTVNGTDKDLIDNLIQTKLCVTDIE